jgi:hypothetical protein
MTENVRLLLVGVLLVLIVVPLLAWDWDRSKWRWPRVSAVLLLAGGVMIGYAIAAGPD